MKMGRLIKIFLNETYSEVCIGSNLAHKFPIQNGLEQGDGLSPFFFFFFFFPWLHSP
jgi:hypothetical protein